MKINSKFCFFGNISGALQGNTAGGGELQIALLAKALALAGHQAVIIDPYARESFVTPEGVRLINVPNWDGGLRGIRLFTNRIPLLYKLLKDQHADYYYIRMRSFLHIIPYIAARRNKARFIQAIAQDIDIVGIREQVRYEFSTNSNLARLFLVNLPSYLVSNFLLKRADFIFLQHSGQKNHSKNLKGKVSVFPNIIYIDELNNDKLLSESYVIHVGTLTVFKGSENLYQLIEKLNSKLRVIIVGKPDDRESVIISDKLKHSKNVTVKGSLDHVTTLNLIANSTALINTSNYEGFPNIFLEAWSKGVPVISLNVNPGNVINEHGLGICCDGDIIKMKENIESIEKNTFEASNLISYVKEFHDFNTAVDRLLNII